MGGEVRDRISGPIRPTRNGPNGGHRFAAVVATTRRCDPYRNRDAPPALTGHESLTRRVPTESQIQKWDAILTPPIEGETTVEDMSMTRNPFRHRRSREPTPGKGHYPACASRPAS